MFQKLKQFKDLRDKAKTLQSALADVSVSGSGARGRVTFTMDGNQTLTNVTISDELLNHGEKSSLESGIKEAFKDALGQLQKKLMEKMKAGEIEMPGAPGGENA